MISPVRPAALPLILAVLAVLSLGVALTVQAQGQEVTPTSAATGDSPPAQPTNLQVSATHDSVSLTWEASSDETVTHYAVLRRDRDRDASGVFHVIDANAGSGTSYTDESVSAQSSYVYRVKAISPTGGQPVVEVRQGRHPGGAGTNTHAHADTHPYANARAGSHARRPGPGEPHRRDSR